MPPNKICTTVNSVLPKTDTKINDWLDDCEVVSPEGGRFVQSNLYVPNIICTVGVAPPRPEVERIATVSNFWDSPAAIILTYAASGTAVCAIILVLNKLQTGRFFINSASEIEVLVSYKEGVLSLNQGAFLLMRSSGMTFQLAVQFLKDDLSGLETK
uniref:Uncharacterized protein n=1 Tax=Tupiella akineta TaxID=160070 RepID=Q3ZJ72_TUPAK|nr:hypothetical protein PsakCp022 [Tupiella akineta]AAV80619.1 hypothetical protein [Tupiella akineta]